MRYRLPKWIDAAVLVIAFFLLVHNVDAPTVTLTRVSLDDYAANVGNIHKQVAAAILVVYGFIVLLINRQRVFTFRNACGSLAILFLAVATASIAWSDSPELSASRWFGMITMIVAAAAAMKRLGTLNIIRWCFVAEMVYLTMGIANELRLGALHPFSTGYRFHGINDPNSTGTEAVILLFASLAMSRRAPSSKLYRTGILLAVAVIVLTRSRTALVSCIGALGLVYGQAYLRPRAIALTVYCATLSMVALFALTEARFINLDAVISLGRPDTSADSWNGRVPLWMQLYQDYAQRSPVAGYGYGAFWTEERIKAISYHSKWKIAAAHSIYLDSLLAVGFVGALLGLLASALRLAKMRTEEGVFWACVLCALLIDGVTDSSPWFIASMYFFMSVQAVFVICSLDVQNLLHNADVSCADERLRALSGQCHGPTF
jgi:hypothetical protein